MNVREFEDLMKADIEEVFTNILKEHDYLFPISARSRSGAEISDYLEDSFVDYINSHPHARIYNPEGAPKGATKNPYDFCFNYKCEDFNYDDLIWGDIKATKFSYADSNPDLGTPEKIITFIMDGHFYLMFVFLEYDATYDNNTKFRQFNDGRYVHCQFLKDINHTVRINPKPQFQVNISEPEEFLELFYIKYQESINRIIEKQTKKKSKLDERFNELRHRLISYSEKFKDINSDN